MIPGWYVSSDPNDHSVDSDTHVMPVEDLKPHEYSRDCWCDPTEDPEEPDVVVHYALDRRELYEHGFIPTN